MFLDFFGLPLASLLLSGTPNMSASPLVSPALHLATDLHFLLSLALRNSLHHCAGLSVVWVAQVSHPVDWHLVLNADVLPLQLTSLV